MVARFGFWAAIASFVFAVAYGIPQVLQVAGILTFPYDEIWIFAPSLLLAPSFVLANASLYETTPGERRIFALAALGSAISEHPVFGLAGLGLGVATGLLVALEGPSMVVAGLERQGWTADAAIVADDRTTAEEIYYMENLTGEATARESARSILPASEAAGRRHAPMLGLVGFKEGR